MEPERPWVLLSWNNTTTTKAKQIRTYKLKRELIANIKVKPPIGNSSYMVNTSETLQLIKSLAGSIPKDLGYIRATYPNL